MTSPRPARRPWTLQRRLIVTVVSIVSLIMVVVAVATSALLGQALEARLNSQVDSLVQRTQSWVRPMLQSGMTAAEILEQQPPYPGFLLAIEAVAGEPTGAVTDADRGVIALTDAQIAELADGLGAPSARSVALDGLGSFRVTGFQVGEAVIVVGVSRADVNATIAQMFTTIGLLTAGGLLLLAAATAWTIRAGLAPLRDIAATADRVSRQPLAEGDVTIAARVPEAQSDPRTEVGQVGAALNTLLDHVSTSLDARQRNEERMRAFVADASHELRTPLASIRGYSELSLRDRELSETTQASLERIQAQSLRMTALVEDLLLLARLDEGQELVYGAVDLSRLAIDAIGDAQVAGGDHTWLLELDDEPVVVAGDTGRLHQVVANLLANARVHTPPGTTVTLSVRRDDDEAVVRVHDDGPGIAPSVTDELFERFSRADRSRARQTGGTGLGLSIARAIADAHEGRLVVRSEPGDTTFELRVPAARPADPPADESDLNTR
ncbi:sensor histidine kinase [Microbacterium koreense]|uniref:histidine kinase n=1 Tax=Microbacterium koreense TaxID=323761 RepID=A0ABW2ZRA4_9MICO